jgi:hypothetical protein
MWTEVRGASGEQTEETVSEPQRVRGKYRGEEQEAH